MAERYVMAVSATETNDLTELTRMLSYSVQEVIQENGMPHMDPAVQLIAFHIAFAGNGDSTFLSRYDSTYKYCRKRVVEGPNAVIYPTNNQKDKNGPEEPPVLQAS